MRTKYFLLALIALMALPGSAQARSPDGVIIFGAWWDSNRDGVALADTDIHSLFQLETDLGGAVQITPITQQEGSIPLVRPDGLTPFYLDRNGALHNASRTISRERVVGSAYSPDASRLVILTQAANLPNRSLSVVDGRTGVLVQFTGANVDDTSFSLSPDGSRVLFTQVFFGVNRLYVLDIRTGAIQPLSDGSFRVSSPRWSPNGTGIAYVRQVDNNRRGYDPGDPRTLWLTDPNGVSQRQISPPGAVDAGAPVWSADSFHIAFLNRIDNDADRRISQADALQLAVADLSTGVVNIVAAGIDFSAVLWNPGGTRLAFRGVTTDTNGDGFISGEDVPVLWVMRSTDAVATPLSSGTQVAGGAVAWRPDGSALAYTIAIHDDNADGKITQLDSTQLVIAPVDAELTRPDRPLLDGPRIGAVAWSPDGASIAIIAQTSTSLGTLIRVTVSNGALAPLTDNSLVVDPTTGLYWVR